MPIAATTAEIHELSEMIGAARVAVLLGRFRVELQASLPLAAADAATKDNAHRIVSQAGMLGFHALSVAARQLEGAIAAKADISALFAAFSGERDAVLQQLSSFAEALTTAAGVPGAVRKTADE